MVVPADPQVDRADRHLLVKGSERFLQVLRLRHDVEDEFAWGVELTSDDDVEVIRTFDDGLSPAVSGHVVTFR
jgi:hypothetical protein